MAFVVVLVFLLVDFAHSFQGASSLLSSQNLVIRKGQRHAVEKTPRFTRKRCWRVSSTSDETLMAPGNVLGGVSGFEEWLKGRHPQKAPTVSDQIQHEVFQGGTLRGLEFTGSAGAAGSNVVGIPSSLVLRAPYDASSKGAKLAEGSTDAAVWDRDLALSLLRECRRGKDSAIYGYCQLLTLGTPTTPNFENAPPSTAPDALRRWTLQEKAYLANKGELGKRLVQVEERQSKNWQSKYDSLSSEEKKSYSLDAFVWAMEAVHSRAFRGNFAVGPLRKAAALIFPLVSAALLAALELNGEGNVNPAVLLGLAALAVSPGVITAIDESRGALAEAVLLPVIDSANHLQSAQSKIEYDPLQDMFTLSIGDNCLVPEEDKTQLYISYGAQTDAELILNYGFLPGVPTSNSANRASVRKQLADAFAQRNE